MVAYFKTEAIVLKVIKYHENKIILHLFSRGYGKIIASSFVSKKINSTSQASYQVGNLICLELQKKQDLDEVLFTASNAYIKEQFLNKYSHENIYMSLSKKVFAEYILELIDRNIEEKQINQVLFDFLMYNLNYMKNNDLKSGIRINFNMEFIKIMGFLPSLYTCVECGNVIEKNEFVFSVEEGGLVCCNKFIQGYKISQFEIKTLQLLNEYYPVNKEIRYSHKLEKILDHFISYHLIHAKNTLSFISTVKNNLIL